MYKMQKCTKYTCLCWGRINPGFYAPMLRSYICHKKVAFHMLCCTKKIVSQRVSAKKFFLFKNDTCLGENGLFYGLNKITSAKNS